MNRLIIYDGKCLLCSRSVKFIKENEKPGFFSYTTYDSPESKQLLNIHNIDFSKQQYILYLRGNKLYKKSRAVLEILKDLGGLLKLFYAFVIVPPPIRDFVYMIISKNRHKL